MNALTPTVEAHLLANASVLPFLNASPMQMGSNIARDLKSRASDFKTKAAAIFEYIVNGYEGCDLDVTPVVEVSTKGGKIVIKDNGIGMTYEKLGDFWTMHGNTERRENGRNKRGYHGSGKSAFWRVGRKIEVRTVKNGLLNVMSLDGEELDAAAISEKPPRITAEVLQRPTDEPSGTTITLSQLNEKFTTEDARLLMDKVAENMRLVMTGAIVTVNGVQVVDRPVKGVESLHTSLCGNFTAKILYNDAGHSNEDDRVFFMVDGIYIAAEQTGKQGHRFSHQVSVLVNTSKEWAAANFEHRREQFMSEARDLTLKTSDPAAKALHDFAESVVKDFMDKLDAEDRARKQEKMSEAEKRLLMQMSRIFSDHLLFGGKTPRVKKEGGERETTKIVVERTHRETSGKGNNDQQRKPKIVFEQKAYEMSDAPYEIERGDELKVFFNTNSSVYKSLSQDERDSVRNAVLWDIAGQAVCQIGTEQEIEEHEQNVGPVSHLDAIKMHADRWARMKNSLSEVYSGYLNAAPGA